MAYDLFISYKHINANDGSLRTPTVRELAQRLETAGLNVFRDETAIDVFEGFTPKVYEGIENTKALLVYFSHDYTQSRACMAELRAMYIAAMHNGWKPAERIFILNPEPTNDHLKDLPVDLRDINAAQTAESAVAKLPGLVEKLDGTFGRYGLRDKPIHYGRMLTGSERFVGRVREMWDIHNLLNASECAQITGHVGHPDMAQVSGMGGIGKSLLAEEYALRFGAAYPGGIFWLSAHGSFNPNAPTDVETFAAACKDQLLALTQNLGKQLPPDTDLRILQHTICKIIEEKKQRCLWIVDDIPCGLAAYMETVKLWLAPHPLARTLLTTRSHEYKNLGGELPLELLDDTGARALLRNHDIDIADQEDAVEDLLERLAGHALALDVAGAAIKENGGHIRQFLDEIEADDTDLMDASHDLTGALPAGHEPSIIKTFKHSIDRLDEPAKDLLRIAANLAPEPIRDEFIELVFRRTDNLDEKEGQRLTKKALRQIAQHSLISRENQCFIVHALISTTVQRLNMTTKERGQALLDKAIELLHNIINPKAPHDEASAISLEIAHARFLTASVDETSSASLLALLIQLGYFDHYRGNVRLTVSDWQQIVKIRSNTLGCDHRETLTSASNLGSALYAAGDYAEAKQLHEKVLDQIRRTLSPDAPEALTEMQKLASVLVAMGDLTTARQLEEQVFKKQKDILGSNHVDTLNTMNSLASTLLAVGELTRARNLLEQAIGKQKDVLGSDHPSTLTSINNLAEVLRAMGNHAKAKQLQENLLKTRMRLLGPNHPETLSSMNNLAMTYHASGDYTNAKKLQEEAIERQTQILGPDHPNTLLSMGNLAGTFGAIGEYSRAKKLQEHVCNRMMNVLGPNHPDTLASMNNLAGTLSDLREHVRARELQENVLKEMKNILGPNHPNTLISISNLAGTLEDMGDHDEAKQLHEEALNKQRKILGPHHPKTTVSAWALYKILINTKHSEYARKILQTDLIWLLEKGLFLHDERQRQIRKQLKREHRHN